MQTLGKLVRGFRPVNEHVYASLASKGVTRPFFDQNLPTTPCVTLYCFRILPRHAGFLLSFSVIWFRVTLHFAPSRTASRLNVSSISTPSPHPFVTRDVIHERTLIEGTQNMLHEHQWFEGVGMKSVGGRGGGDRLVKGLVRR